MPDLQSLSDIAEYHRDAESSLKLLFSRANPDFAVRFATYLSAEIDGELVERISETDLRSSLVTLARIEVAIRSDYRARSKAKWSDNVSIAFRKIHKKYQERARLDDILNVWSVNLLPQDRIVISQLKGFFKFRHWLAHGRETNFAPVHAFQDVYLLANAVVTKLPLQS